VGRERIQAERPAGRERVEVSDTGGEGGCGGLRYRRGRSVCRVSDSNFFEAEWVGEWMGNMRMAVGGGKEVRV
jgi:hypothetical protein